MSSFLHRFSITISLVSLVYPCAIIVLLFTLSPRICTASPLDAPILTLNTAGHTAQIQDMDVDASSKLLLTVAYDKTARIWSLADGKELKVLRPPIAMGNEGLLFAGAISPDGMTAAVAGVTGFEWYGHDRVYIFDTSTSIITHVIDDLPGTIHRLKFSRDGKFLSIGLHRGGIRVFGTHRWELVKSDTGYAGAIYGLSFDARGRLVSASDSGEVALYNSDFSLLHKYRLPDGYSPARAEFSPDGKYVAIGMFDQPRVFVLSGDDLKGQKVLDLNMHTKGPGREETPELSWSQDDGKLYIVNRGVSYDGHALVAVYEPTTWAAESRFISEQIGNIVKIGSIPSGGLIFSGSYGEWGASKFDKAFRSEVNDFQGASLNLPNFKFSPDTFTLNPLWGGKYSGFSARDPSILPYLPGETNDPQHEGPGMKLESWHNSYRPLLNGVVLKLADEELARVAAVHGDRAAIGTSFSVRVFNKKGDQLWERPFRSVVAVDFSVDGKVVVSATANGIISWLRASDGQQFLSLFLAADGKRWVLWTPSGYYEASPGGEDLIGWHVNRGTDQAADFFPASRFEDKMHRPDIVRMVLNTLDEGEAVRLANAAAGLKDGLTTSQTVATLLPPVIDLISAPASFSSDRVTIKFRVRSPDNVPWLGEPRVKVNGEWQARSRAVSQVEPDVRTLTVAGLPPRDSVVEVYADNENATSTPLIIRLTWNKNFAPNSGLGGLIKPVPPASPTIRSPRLFVLAIGISQYQRPDLRLTFADHDAEQLVAAMMAQQGREYTSVKTKLLVNGQATRAAVMEGLNWLQSQVAADDVGLLFLAGHGLEASDSHYFFAPADFDPNHPRDSGVEYIAIRDALVRFEGKGNRAIFLIDTCHSGGVLGANTVSSSGEAFGRSLGASQYAMAGLTSSTGGQVSLEKVDWGDGAFTKALLEGIVQAKAESADSHEITMLGLSYYVSQRVKFLTQQAQTPMFISPESGLKDFVIAVH